MDLLDLTDRSDRTPPFLGEMCTFSRILLADRTAEGKWRFPRPGRV